MVIRISGPEEPLVLKEKGKKYGFLWMNVGEIHYEAIPTIYLLKSSRAPNDIASPETLDRLKIGADALRDRIFAETGGEAREFFGELVKLKEWDLESAVGEKMERLKEVRKQLHLRVPDGFVITSRACWRFSNPSGQQTASRNCRRRRKTRLPAPGGLQSG